MKVLVFETNLMWSSRLVKSLRGLGHEAEVRTELPEPDVHADAAIVNLGDAHPDPKELVHRLKKADVFVIGHAGHKEKDLHALGREAGCDRLASNSELTFKLETLLP
jgi:hypothetical protein